MRELRRCPFCGGEAEIRKEVDTSFMGGVAFIAYKVVCSKCWASPLPNNYYGDKQEAIELWNRREPTDRIVEQLENAKHPNVNLLPTEYAYNMGLCNAIEIVKGGAE